jgi:hypothetical protein
VKTSLCTEQWDRIQILRKIWFVLGILWTSACFQISSMFLWCILVVKIWAGFSAHKYLGTFSQFRWPLIGAVGRLALRLVSTVLLVYAVMKGGGDGILFDERVLRVPPREDWMIYRGPGFLAVIWFGSMPCPFPPQKSASCLSFSGFCVSPVKLTDGKGWGERMVVESNHSIAQESLAV